MNSLFEQSLKTLKNQGISLPQGRVTLDAYGDSPELSIALLALIKQGSKRAGSSLLWSYAPSQEPLPAVGDIAIVLDHLQQPALITRNLTVEITPYEQVSAAYAAIEGEGDGSLAYWREVHWAYFARECERLGLAATASMPVVCVTFELLQTL
jgi:uncharacterized protein YhfF